MSRVARLGCPPKPVSYRNNRNQKRNQFWHYPKHDVCYGCFALISKQGVSVFRNNRNKQKTNRSNSKFVKISTFLIPHTKSSVCFGCFDTSPKHRNKQEKKFGGFVKKQTEKQLKQIEFRFVSVRTEKKKITISRTPQYRTFFGDFFSLFRENSVCFGCFDTGPKHQNKPKKSILVSRNQPKNNRNRLSFGLFWFEPKKKFDCFDDTLGQMASAFLSQ